MEERAEKPDKVEEEWKKVGFGWTNTGKHRIEDIKQGNSKVSLLISSIPIHFTTFEEEFPSFDFYSHLKEAFPRFPLEYHHFRVNFQQCLQNYFLSENPRYSFHYEDFITNKGISNQRPLRWDIMHIPSHLSFNLHAHPNIEIIWVIAGTIHEYRLVDRTSRYPEVHCLPLPSENKMLIISFSHSSRNIFKNEKIKLPLPFQVPI